jgi:hypothetical protein
MSLLSHEPLLPGSAIGMCPCDVFVASYPRSGLREALTTAAHATCATAASCVKDSAVGDWGNVRMIDS